MLVSACGSGEMGCLGSIAAIASAGMGMGMGVAQMGIGMGAQSDGYGLEQDLRAFVQKLEREQKSIFSDSREMDNFVRFNIFLFTIQEIKILNMFIINLLNNFEIGNKF